MAGLGHEVSAARRLVRHSGAAVSTQRMPPPKGEESKGTSFSMFMLADGGQALANALEADTQNLSGAATDTAEMRGCLACKI